MSNLKKGLVSSALLVAESIGGKLIGLISTLILARVLVPEDFGLVAMATVVLGLVETLGNIGSQQYLLKVEKLTKDIVNTAWTIDFILKSGLAILLGVLSIPLANFYGDDRLTAILLAFSCMLFLATLINPGLAFYRFEQNYKLIVKNQIFAKVLAVTVAVLIAVIYQSYWALVLGTITNVICRVIGSHFIHKHKIAFCFENAKTQWHFSGWLVPQGLLGYLRTQLDTFIVSSNFSIQTLGSYHALKYLAFIPSLNIVTPATEPLMRQLASVKYNKKTFKVQHNASLLITLIIAIPISTMMFVHHDPIITVFLGDKWTAYSEIFGIFGLLITALAMLQHSRKVLMVFDNTQIVLVIEVITFVFIYGTLVLFFTTDIREFSLLRVSLECFCSSVIFLWVSARYISLQNTLFLCASIMLIVLISVFSALCTLTMSSMFEHVYMQLMLICATFSLTFLLLLMLSIFTLKKYSSDWKYIYDKFFLKLIVENIKRCF